MVSIDAFESRNQPLSDGVWAVGIEPVDVEELMSQWGGHIHDSEFIET